MPEAKILHPMIRMHPGRADRLLMRITMLFLQPLHLLFNYDHLLAVPHITPLQQILGFPIPFLLGLATVEQVPPHYLCNLSWQISPWGLRHKDPASRLYQYTYTDF